jgi:hypothetical protein
LAPAPGRVGPWWHVVRRARGLGSSLSHRWPPSVTGRGAEEVQRIRERASVGQPVGPVRIRVPKATIAVTDSAHRPLDKGAERRVCAHGCWFCAGVDLGGVVGEGVARGKSLGRGGECVQGCARRCGPRARARGLSEAGKRKVGSESRPGRNRKGGEKEAPSARIEGREARHADVASLRHARRGTRHPAPGRKRNELTRARSRTHLFRCAT